MKPIVIFISLIFGLLLANFSHATAAKKSQITKLRVLTLNVHGLPSPIKKSHGEIRKIGEILQQRRSEGTQPQIVALQEGFRTKEVQELIELSGYKYVYRGPKASKKSSFDGPAKRCRPNQIACSDKYTHPVINSGLYILSDFPILEAANTAYGYKSCAGWDCLANKGAAYAEIQIPGFSKTLHLFTTHMNSTNSSGAAPQKNINARIRQVNILDWFLDQTLSDRVNSPTIVLGDFNQSPWSDYAHNQPYDLLISILNMKNAQGHCIEERNSGRNRCQILSKESDDRIYGKSADHQFFKSGTGLTLEPVEMNHSFYEKVDGKYPVSDHLGVEIVYKLSK